MDQLQLLEAITKSAGLAAAILSLACVILLRLYYMERTDRREAWKAHNELSKATNEVLLKLTIVLESIRQEVLKGNK